MKQSPSDINIVHMEVNIRSVYRNRGSLNRFLVGGILINVWILLQQSRTPEKDIVTARNEVGARLCFHRRV